MKTYLIFVTPFACLLSMGSFYTIGKASQPLFETIYGRSSSAMYC